MAESDSLSPIQIWGAVNDTMKTPGWKYIMERYQKEGDGVLSEILDRNTNRDIRQLKVHELYSLGALSRILKEMEDEAVLQDKKLKEPSHIGD